MLRTCTSHDGAYTHIALTRYLPATSFAWSTSHLMKLTFGYCLDKASKVGAIIWQGPHLIKFQHLSQSISH